jgi:hypothetical protein
MRKLIGLFLCVLATIIVVNAFVMYYVHGYRFILVLGFVFGSLFYAVGALLMRWKRLIANSDAEIAAAALSGRDVKQLVTICTYPVAGPAEAAKFFLDQQGIPAYVADANTLRADWFLGPAIGWVKLQVADLDAEAAIAFLKNHPNLVMPSGEEPDNDGETRCLSCGNRMDENAMKCASCGWSYGDQAANPAPGTIASDN